jgi:hypothetical protein
MTQALDRLRPDGSAGLDVQDVGVPPELLGVMVATEVPVVKLNGEPA